MNLNSNQLQPGISIDCVIFGFHENQLRVLLLKPKNIASYMLPGGFIEKNQDADDAAHTVLKNRTGLAGVYLSQFRTFGAPDRSKPDYITKLVEAGVLRDEEAEWFNQRFITIGYFALLEFEKVENLQPDLYSELIDWFPIESLPNLLLDHQTIIKEALTALKQRLNTTPIGLNLLPEEFTMPELQVLYETILGKSLDRRNFRRKILSFDILTDTGKRRAGGAHKAPILYRFNKTNYQKALEEGLSSGW